MTKPRLKEHYQIFGEKFLIFLPEMHKTEECNLLCYSRFNRQKRTQLEDINHLSALITAFLQRGSYAYQGRSVFCQQSLC